MKHNWIEIDFFKGFTDIFKEDGELLLDLKKIRNFLLEKKITNSDNFSLESAADRIAEVIAREIDLPVVINGFPVWSSPLYAPSEKNTNIIQRSKFYLPGQKGGFEAGVQENDYNRFTKRLLEQSNQWSHSGIGVNALNSALTQIISGGVPPSFGIGINPDRIAKIWYIDSSIDPYKELD